MFHSSLLWPMLAQVLLTFIVMIRLYATRIPEFRAKSIHPDAVKTRKQKTELLVDSANSADNFSNLFEMPILFYVAMLLALVLLLSDPLLVGLAWMYVGLRYVHSFIHTTYNAVWHRFIVFLASALVLLVIWVRIAAITVLN